MSDRSAPDEPFARPQPGREDASPNSQPAAEAGRPNTPWSAPPADPAGGARDTASQTGWMPPQQAFGPAPQTEYGPPQGGYDPLQAAYGPPQGVYGAPPQPAYGPSPQATWVVPPPPAGGWQPPYAYQPAQPGPSPRRRRMVEIALCAALVAAGALLGVGVSHDFWISRGGAVVLAPSGSGSGSSGSSGFPFGGGGSSGYPFGDGGGSGSGGSNGLPLPFGGGRSVLGGSSSSAQGAPRNIASIASKVDPGLVDINLTLGDSSAGVTGAATGIVLSPSGLVLTNNHVVNGATTLKATDLGNGRTYSATVVGYDASHDVALIQLQGAAGLETVTLGDSAKITVGQPVVGIGNAGGVGGKPSTAGGKITALDRQITAGDLGSAVATHLTGLIETNAYIQRGDSGGPLVDSAGRVIGMDTAASSAVAFNPARSQGFAVPIDTAITIVRQIENHQGSATVHIGPTAFLGVRLSPGAGRRAGATILGVVPGSPAARAGLKTGDTITSVDGRAVGSSTALTSLIGGRQPGDRVQIGWTERSGVRHTSTVQLTAGPAH